MNIYRILFFAAVLFYIADRCKICFSKEKFLRRAGGCLAIALFVICGFRGLSVGTDTKAYKNLYDIVSNCNSIRAVFQTFHYDVGFYSAMWFFIKLHSNFHLFCVGVAAISIFPVAVLIQKYCRHSMLAYTIYIAMGLWTFNFSGMRQGAAIGISVLAYMQLRECKGRKGIIRFLVVWLFAVSFHYSAVIFIVTLFARRVRFRKDYVFILLAVSGVFWIISPYMVNSVFRVAGMISSQYKSYTPYGDGVYGVGLYCLIAAYVLLDLFFTKHDKKTESVVWPIMSMLLIFPFVARIGGGAMRVYYYFYIYSVIYIPDVLDRIADRKWRTVFRVLTLLFLTGYVFATNFEESCLMPYSFCGLLE